MNRRRFVCAFAASAATFACVGDVSAATHEAGRLIDPSIDIGLNAPRPCSTLASPNPGHPTPCPQLAHFDIPARVAGNSRFYDAIADHQ